MEGSPENLEETGPIRCLRMAGALLRMDGEPLAAIWLKENCVAAIDDQGMVQEALREEGSWKCGPPIQLDPMPNLATFCGGTSRIVGSSGLELGVWLQGEAEPLWWLETDSWITAVAGHPVLKLFASGHEDGCVRFWDAKTGELLRCWNRSEDQAVGKNANISISALAWHPSEPKLLAANESLSVIQLGLETAASLTLSSGHKGRIVALGFDPLGRFLYSGGWDGTVRVWDAKTGAPVILLNNHSALVTCLSVSKDGATLCVGDNSPSWSLWDVPGWQKQGQGNFLPADPRALDIGPQGGESLIALQDGRVLDLEWDQRLRMGLKQFRNNTFPRSVCLKESNVSYLCLGAEGCIQRWNKKDHGSLWDGTHCSMHVGDFGGPLRAIALTVGENGQGLLASKAAPGTLSAYQAASPGQPYCLVGVIDTVPGEGELVALSPRGDLAVCASERALDVAVYRFPGLEPVALIPDPLGSSACQDLAFGPCGGKLALGGVKTFVKDGDLGSVVVVDIHTGNIVNEIRRGIWRLAWHPGGEEMLLSGVNGDLFRWRLENGGVEVLEHTAEGPMEVIGYTGEGEFCVASWGNDELWVFEAGRNRPSGTVSLPGRVVAVSPGKNKGSIVALLAGGDGWEIDLTAWLAEKSP